MRTGFGVGEGRTFILCLLIFRGSLAAFAQSDLIQLSTNYYSALEDSGAVTIQLVRTGPMTDYATLQVRTETGSADTNDFRSFWRTVTFEPRQSILTLSVEIFNDALIEG